VVARVRIAVKKRSATVTFAIRSTSQKKMWDEKVDHDEKKVEWNREIKEEKKFGLVPKKVTEILRNLRIQWLLV